MRYTIGPWKLRLNPDENDRLRHLYYIDGPENGQPICEVRNYQKIGENNGSLISAAPEMYEALKILGDWPLNSKCFDGTIAKNAAERPEGVPVIMWGLPSHRNGTFNGVSSEPHFGKVVKVVKERGLGASSSRPLQFSSPLRAYRAYIAFTYLQ